MLTALCSGIPAVFTNSVLTETDWDAVARLGFDEKWAERYLRSMTEPWLVVRSVLRLAAAGMTADDLNRFLAHQVHALDLDTAIRRTPSLVWTRAFGPDQCLIPQVDISGRVSLGLSANMFWVKIGMPQRMLAVLDANSASTNGLPAAGDAVRLVDVLLADLMISQVLGVPDLAMPHWRAALGLTDQRGPVRMTDEHAQSLHEWVGAVGADGWAWAAAGYTATEAAVLVATPEGDARRPSQDQLVVMAALRH